MGSDFRDYDNDGRQDLFFTALSDELFMLYRNLIRRQQVLQHDCAQPYRAREPTILGI